MLASDHLDPRHRRLLDWLDAAVDNNAEGTPSSRKRRRRRRTRRAGREHSNNRKAYAVDADHVPHHHNLVFPSPPATTSASAASPPSLSLTGNGPAPLPLPARATGICQAMSHPLTPNKKRPRGGDDDGDNDADDRDLVVAMPPQGMDNDQTPRAPWSVAAPPSEGASSPSSSHLSSVSRTSSPSKQLKLMELNDSGFSRGKFAAWPLPPEIAMLVRDIEVLSVGVGAVAASLKAQITASAIPDVFLFGDHVFSESPALPTVPLDKIQRIVKRANRCELRMEDEASWNMEVHHHILRTICRPQGQPGLVDFISCTTAKISPVFRPRSAPSKMIDFCICINAASSSSPDDAAAAQAIERVRATRPRQSINHTDYAPLADAPITVSIETKRGPENWSQALLQMGVWQAAQLRSLRALRALRVSADGSRMEDAGRDSASIHGEITEEEGIQGRAGALPAEVETAVLFLPGVIIQGHDWSFVLSARDGSRSILLTKVAIGTTESPLGIFKILAVLSRLVRWSKETYWPAFKRDALGMGG